MQWFVPCMVASNWDWNTQRATNTQRELSVTYRQSHRVIIKPDIILRSRPARIDNVDFNTNIINEMPGGIPVDKVIKMCGESTCFNIWPMRRRLVNMTMKNHYSNFFHDNR